MPKTSTDKVLRTPKTPRSPSEVFGVNAKPYPLPTKKQRQKSKRNPASHFMGVRG